jgi:hypothetical protein
VQSISPNQRITENQEYSANSWYKEKGQENSFKSFSLSANPLPVDIPAKGLHRKMLQPEKKSFSRTLWGYAYSAQIGSPMLQKSYIQALVTVLHP